MTSQIDGVLLNLQAELNSLHREGRTWRKIASALGVSTAQVHHIAHGRFDHASWETIRRLCENTSQGDPGALDFILPCPIHGEPHIVDCHGKSGTPVMLAAQEYIKMLKPIADQPGKTELRPRLPRDPQARIAKLQALLRQAEAELQEAA